MIALHMITFVWKADGGLSLNGPTASGHCVALKQAVMVTLPVITLARAAASSPGKEALHLLPQAVWAGLLRRRSAVLSENRTPVDVEAFTGAR